MIKVRKTPLIGRLVRQHLGAMAATESQQCYKIIGQCEPILDDVMEGYCITCVYYCSGASPVLLTITVITVI